MITVHIVVTLELSAAVKIVRVGTRVGSLSPWAFGESNVSSSDIPRSGKHPSTNPPTEKKGVSSWNNTVQTVESHLCGIFHLIRQQLNSWILTSVVRVSRIWWTQIGGTWTRGSCTWPTGNWLWVSIRVCIFRNMWTNHEIWRENRWKG